MDSFEQYALPQDSVIAVADPVRDGVESLVNPLDRELPVHAAEVIQRNAFQNERQLREEMMSRAFGKHAMLSLRREQEALAQFRRGPGMPSSLIGLEISMGIHDKIDFCDYMGGPSRSTDIIDYHVAMEKRMNALDF